MDMPMSWSRCSRFCAVTTISINPAESSAGDCDEFRPAFCVGVTFCWAIDVEVNTTTATSETHPDLHERESMCPTPLVPSCTLANRIGTSWVPSGTEIYTERESHDGYAMPTSQVSTAMNLARL